LNKKSFGGTGVSPVLIYRAGRARLFVAATGRPIRAFYNKEIKVMKCTFRQYQGYLNRMIDCGCYIYNSCVENALRYLPEDVFEQYKEKLAFISTTEACRISRHYCETREIILFAPGIFPKGISHNEPEARYFIFTVLHEVVHAIKKHKAKKFDKLTDQEIQAQENEADAIAIKWYNEYLERNNFCMELLTIEEINDTRKKNRDQIKADLGIK
jgi:hypothetical protein